MNIIWNEDFKKIKVFLFVADFCGLLFSFTLNRFEHGTYIKPVFS